MFVLVVGAEGGQAAVAIAIMFGAYIMHTTAMPYLTRENIPQTFFDIINAEATEVWPYSCRSTVTVLFCVQ